VATLTRPRYERGALAPGVVHIGVGDFHRAHQATYFHELAQGGERDWGIVGVSLRSRALKEALEPQGLRYTVIERAADGDAAHVIGAMLAYLHAPEDPEAVLRALSDPRIRLVTLTVTHHGYCVDPTSGRFEPGHPAVRADLACPRRPATFFGYLTEALARRRRAGTPPFAVLSCDNVPRAGEVARRSVVSFARLRDPELAGWIERCVPFPSSMVDRITPQCSEEIRRYVREDLGLDDAVPVTTEPFRQWIVEDAFGGERPPLGHVGVEFVADTSPYELVKQRMLNGAHSALAYLGYLAGYRTAHDVMRDPRMRAFADRLLEEEVMPLLPDLACVGLADYKETIIGRLANPNIVDELQRLCRRGSTKVPAFVLSSLHEARESGLPHDMLVLAVAAWVRYLRGTDLRGRPIAIDDPRADELARLAADPRRLLAERSLFGELAMDRAFGMQVREALAALERHGPRRAVDAALAGLARPQLRAAA
jgi:mannitol 2-dehydrogenase